jgi:hypothetical protein
LFSKPASRIVAGDEDEKGREEEKKERKEPKHYVSQSAANKYQ